MSTPEKDGSYLRGQETDIKMSEVAKKDKPSQRDLYGIQGSFDDYLHRVNVSGAKRPVSSGLEDVPPPPVVLPADKNYKSAPIYTRKITPEDNM